MGKSHSEYSDLFSPCRVHLHQSERKYASQRGRMLEANNEVMNDSISCILTSLLLRPSPLSRFDQLQAEGGRPGGYCHMHSDVIQW